MKISFDELKILFNEKLRKYGVAESDAATMSEIFTESTFDGIFTHGINRFPRFIAHVKQGIVKVSRKPTLLNASGAFEQWEGHLGAGILNALHCTERAMHLAADSGIGIATLRNTNHWMRAGTYGRMAAERGFIFIGWTNTIPNMPAWESPSARIGNNPFVLAIPYKEEPLVLDMAMSQFAYGKLEWMKRTGQKLDMYGGYNRKGELTKDPAEILETERILPIGLWKGSGFAIVLDLAAAILSTGITTKEIGKKGVDTGMSQVFIALDANSYLSLEAREALIGETLAYIQEDGHGSYPGRRVMKHRAESRRQGVDIPDDVLMEIKNL